jgi:hypothetical protein
MKGWHFGLVGALIVGYVLAMYWPTPGNWVKSQFS